MSKSPSEPLKLLISHKAINFHTIEIDSNKNRMSIVFHLPCNFGSRNDFCHNCLFFCTNRTDENKNKLVLIDVYLPVAETQLTVMSYNSIERWCDARCYLRLFVTLSLSLFLSFSYFINWLPMRCRL